MIGKLFNIYIKLKMDFRKARFIFNLRLEALRKGIHLELNIGDALSVGKRVKIELGGKKCIWKIGNGVAIADGVFFNIIDGEIDLGDEASIKRECLINVFGGKLVFVKTCGLSQRTIIHCSKEITIGSYTAVSEYSTIVDSSHIVPKDPVEKNWIRLGEVEKAPVKIGSYVYIGAKATILMGVTIGDYSIIGANSLIAKDVPPKSTAIGVPARIISRERNRKTGV